MSSSNLEKVNASGSTWLAASFVRFKRQGKRVSCGGSSSPLSWNQKLGKTSNTTRKETFFLPWNQGRIFRRFPRCKPHGTFASSSFSFCWRFFIFIFIFCCCFSFASHPSMSSSLGKFSSWCSFRRGSSYSSSLASSFSSFLYLNLNWGSNFPPQLINHCGGGEGGPAFETPLGLTATLPMNWIPVQSSRQTRQQFRFNCGP